MQALGKIKERPETQAEREREKGVLLKTVMGGREGGWEMNEDGWRDRAVSEGHVRK